MLPTYSFHNQAECTPGIRAWVTRVFEEFGNFGNQPFFGLVTVFESNSINLLS